MASAKDMLDQTLQAYDIVPPSDAQYAARRARLLIYLQQMYNLTWNFRPWVWTYKEGAQVTWLSGANSITLAALAADFMEFGPEGSLYDPNRKIRFKEKSPYIVERVRNEMTTNYDNYPFFCIYGAAVQFPYTATSNITLLPFYRFLPETLADNATAMVLPDRWAVSVMLPALVMRAQLSKNDARDDWEKFLRQGLIEMSVVENPVRTMTHRWPLAVRRAW